MRRIGFFTAAGDNRARRASVRAAPADGGDFLQRELLSQQSSGESYPAGTELPHLRHMSDGVLDEYAEIAE